MCFCEAFETVAQFACACNEKLTAFYFCESLQQYIYALIIDKSSRKEHLYAVFVGGFFREDTSARYSEIILGSDAVGQNPALMAEFVEIKGVLYMTLGSGQYYIGSFQQIPHERLVEKHELFLLDDIAVP